MPNKRDVARALLFDDDDRLVLLHWRDPLTGHEFLEPPGGAVIPGETFEEALRREISEETGIVEVQIQDLVTEIDHAFTFAGEHYDCRERFFRCRILGSDRRDPMWDPVEKSGIVGVESWTLEELIAQPKDRLEPPQLIEILNRGRGSV